MWDWCQHCCVLFCLLGNRSILARITKKDIQFFQKAQIISSIQPYEIIISISLFVTLIKRILCSWKLHSLNQYSDILISPKRVKLVLLMLHDRLITEVPLSLYSSRKSHYFGAFWKNSDTFALFNSMVSLRKPNKSWKKCELPSLSWA